MLGNRLTAGAFYVLLMPELFAVRCEDLLTNLGKSFALPAGSDD